MPARRVARAGFAGRPPESGAVSALQGSCNHLGAMLPHMIKHAATKRLAVRAVTATIAAVALTTGVIAASTSSASADDCVYDKPDEYNGRYWFADPKGHPSTGSVMWMESGDKLRVSDYKPDGVREGAKLWVCVGGAFKYWGKYDSGKNEGDVDTNTYNFDFTEGRAVKFQACRVKNGDYYKCGEMEVGVS
jgi:hypothetical protein